MNTDDLKFPTNQAQVEGRVSGYVIDNEEKHRISFAVSVYDGDNKTTGKANYKYIHVLVSGEEKYNAIKEHFKDYNLDEKQNRPFVKITGQAFFSSNKNEEKGITHQNYSIIATGNMKEFSERFAVAKTQAELSEKLGSNNSLSEKNKVDVKAIISSDVKIQEGRNGNEFAVFSVAHNYMTKSTEKYTQDGKNYESKIEESKAMFANVVVPKDQMGQLRNGNFSKGTQIVLSGTPQPGSYLNKNNERVNTFSIIATGIGIDQSKTVTVKNAVESVNTVANTKNQKERLAKAEELTNYMKGKQEPGEELKKFKDAPVPEQKPNKKGGPKI